MQSEIQTERLLLNRITEDDHGFLLTLVNTEGWLAFIGDRNVHSPQDAICYIRGINNLPDYTYWVVRLKSSRIPIGVVSFIKRNYLDNFDIGFALLPEFNGNGYAYEAARMVLTVVGDTYSPVLATALPQNTKSIRLLTRLGFHFEKEITPADATLHLYSNQQTC